MKRIAVSIAVLSLCVTLLAYPTPEGSLTNDVQAIVSAQFGTQFVLSQAFPILTGDFNGDGVEDIAVVVTSHGALQTDSSRFRVIDPSSEYFGIGDPKITAQFASQYPGGSRYLLIIHGLGKDGWRAKEPKERFLLINVNFDRISVGHIARKKKAMDDIDLEETGVLTSFLYWNGHRYKWQPGATQM
ncbi:MAG: hypothetical protein DMG61_21805 [Acidobacteria bacterium]|nr:MAG: hypothetical protein DMG61_21805 [Acidobacteriota bacterium]PYY18726.1 MAG: hypothetical protein DMG60_07315 [Acidobacteriota bacterium]